MNQGYRELLGRRFVLSAVAESTEANKTNQGLRATSFYKINLQQSFSSLPSVQSFNPLHICLTSIHCSVLSHLNCSARHSHNISSEPSAHLLSPSQTKLALIHLPFEHSNLSEAHLYSIGNIEKFLHNNNE
jgi:hypothetical protein